MPASGKLGKMSQIELQQRRKASRTHGIYALRDRGEEAMTPSQRGAYAELQAQLSTRAGTIEALRDAAANTIMLAQVAQSYCVKQHQAGVPLGDIPLLRALPAFWNSAGRAIKSYLDTLPDEQEVLDLGEMIAQAVKDHEQNS